MLIGFFKKILFRLKLYIKHWNVSDIIISLSHPVDCVFTFKFNPIFHMIIFNYFNITVI